MDLDVKVENIWGIGPSYVKKLHKLGIFCARDLLYFFPRRYEDYSHITEIRSIKVGETQTIVGKLLSSNTFRTPRQKRWITEALFSDETGVCKAVWFNQPFLKNSLKNEETYMLSGRVEFGYGGVQFSSPVYERIIPQPNLLPQGEKEQDEVLSYSSSPPEGEGGGEGLNTTHTGRIVPIYPLTEGLTSKWLRAKIKPLLGLSKDLSEDLPAEILKDENLYGVEHAINQIHFPDTLEDFENAKRRFSLEELLTMMLAIESIKSDLSAESAPKIDFDKSILTIFKKNLPYALTVAQERVIVEILVDMARTKPMMRLLEGDVGSGKTVVAAMAILGAVKSGFQAALMAPTGILAAQHYQGLSKLLKPFGVCVGLLTNDQIEINGQEKIKRKDIVEVIATGKVDLVVGTHALVSDDIKFAKLGLAIIDEQHRFGVEQRQKIKLSSGLKNMIPHLLSMTATPIPRTLAMTVYGDLNLSVIDEMPANRKPIISRVVKDQDRVKAYEFIKAHVAAGNQVYVVCPRIEEGESEDVASAIKTYKTLSEGPLRDLKLALLHGKLKAGEKDSVMTDFKSGKTSILVSTSVVEVGVDVPKATIIMIEGAERFGLAQLHQLRGRVGRSDKQSFCLLFSSNNAPESSARLSLFASTNDGFKLAEEDMKMRGSGDIWGTKQSGFDDLRIATLTDYDLVQKSKKWADRLFDQGLENYPNLQSHVEKFLFTKHRE